jgi:hypothetical protein
MTAHVAIGLRRINDCFVPGKAEIIDKFVISIINRNHHTNNGVPGSLISPKEPMIGKRACLPEWKQLNSKRQELSNQIAQVNRENGPLSTESK